MIRQFWTLVNKEMAVEWRTKEIFYTMLLFGGIIVVIFGFGFFERAVAAKAASGVLWTSILFAGTIAIQRSFEREKEGHCIVALSLIPNLWLPLFLAKWLANVIFLVLLEMLIAPMVLLIFQFQAVPQWGGMALVLFLGIVGYATLGTLVGAMMLHVRLKSILLPLVLFPLVLPIFGIGVTASSGLMANRTQAWGYVPVLAALDFLLLWISAWLFGRLFQH